jgi:large subunit ribosomal protein L20
MARVKRGTTHVKRRRNLLKQVKGYMWGRKNLIKLAKVAILKAGTYAYRDRRNKKRDMRRLWNTKIGAGLYTTSLNYSKFIGGLKKQDIQVNRKVLAELAEHNPEVFSKLVETVEKA